jgi:HlyD family secretion protein
MAGFLMPSLKLTACRLKSEFVRIKNRKMKIIKKFSGWIRSHKIVFGLILFLVLLGAIYLPSKVKAIIQGPEAKYETVKPRTADLVRIVDASGEIKAEDEVVLKFQISGELTWVGVKKGDQVKKWQAVASLDKEELQKKLEKELYDYLEERWDFEQTHEDYETSGMASEKWLITDVVKRVLEKAQFSLNKTILDYEIANIAVELATIYSPINGIVTEVDVPIAGVNITPATATFTIANPEIMVFEANIDEADIGQIKIDQKVIINLDAYPEEQYEGKISKIDFAAITTRGGGTAFPVQIILPENQDLKFKIGMNGDVEVVIEEKENVLSLPLEAIKEKDSQAWVRVIENKKVVEAQVETGLATETRIEIISGLTKDQKVIIGEKKAD